MINKPYCIDIYQGDDVLDKPGAVDASNGNGRTE